MKQPSKSSGTSASGGAPVDADGLLRRCMDDASLAAMILDRFERQLPKDLEELWRAVGAGDARQVAQTAHALKGAAGAVSATDLAGCAAKLELMGRGGDLALAEQCLAALDGEIQRCMSFLPQIRGTIAGRSGPPGGCPCGS
jgi:HPt (histidine-containing phosphotransfer) domain-containing protein